jgi:hypothetical protein
MVKSVMKTNTSHVLFFLFSAELLFFINGYPKNTKNNKSENLQTIGDLEQSGQSSFLSLFFDKTFSSAEVKKSSANDELLAKCKRTKGSQRTRCVAAYIRDLYPDSFRWEKDVENSADNKQKTTVTLMPPETSKESSATNTSPSAHSSKATSSPISTVPSTGTSNTNCDTRHAQKRKQTTRKLEKTGEILISSAFLIVPGDPKIIMSVIQDADTTSFVNDERIQPVTCRRGMFFIPYWYMYKH